MQHQNKQNIYFIKHLKQLHSFEVLVTVAKIITTKLKKINLAETR